jgi:hypothetical protein
MSDRVIGAVTSTGSVYAPADGQRKLPPKGWRKHRWIAVASHVLSEEQAEGAYEPGNRVLMDGSNLWTFSIGCIDCEEPYESVKDKRCNAPAYIDPADTRGER